MISEIIDKAVNEIDKEDIKAIGLMGSYARGDAKKYSDIDIVCFVDVNSKERETSIEIINDKYVVTSYIKLEEVEESFTDLVKATESIIPFRNIETIWDPNGYFDNLRERANNFRWNDSLKIKANEHVSNELISWIEEVHKSIQGLISNDTGRMLNGIFGLTFGLFKVIIVYRGILLNGDNSLYNAVIDCFGSDETLVNLSEKAFGVGKSKTTIQERIVSGLNLFDKVTDNMIDDLNERAKKAIIFTKKEIKTELRNLESIM